MFKEKTGLHVHTHEFHVSKAAPQELLIGEGNRDYKVRTKLLSERSL